MNLDLSLSYYLLPDLSLAFLSFSINLPFFLVPSFTSWKPPSNHISLLFLPLDSLACRGERPVLLINRRELYPKPIRLLFLSQLFRFRDCWYCEFRFRISIIFFLLEFICLFLPLDFLPADTSLLEQTLLGLGRNFEDKNGSIFCTFFRNFLSPFSLGD